MTHPPEQAENRRGGDPAAVAVSAVLAAPGLSLETVITRHDITITTTTDDVIVSSAAAVAPPLVTSFSLVRFPVLLFFFGPPAASKGSTVPGATPAAGRVLAVAPPSGVTAFSGAAPGVAPLARPLVPRAWGSSFHCAGGRGFHPAKGGFWRPRRASEAVSRCAGVKRRPPIERVSPAPRRCGPRRASADTADGALAARPLGLFPEGSRNGQAVPSAILASSRPHAAPVPIPASCRSRCAAVASSALRRRPFFRCAASLVVRPRHQHGRKTGGRKKPLEGHKCGICIISLSTTSHGV